MRDEYNRLFASVFVNPEAVKKLCSYCIRDDTDGTQIDLLISRNDNVINMCEIKYYSWNCIS